MTFEKGKLYHVKNVDNGNSYIIKYRSLSIINGHIFDIIAQSMVIEHSQLDTFALHDPWFSRWDVKPIESRDLPLYLCMKQKFPLFEEAMNDKS